MLVLLLPPDRRQRSFTEINGPFAARGIEQEETVVVVQGGRPCFIFNKIKIKYHSPPAARPAADDKKVSGQQHGCQLHAHLDTRLRFGHCLQSIGQLILLANTTFFFFFFLSLPVCRSFTRRGRQQELAVNATRQ